MSITEAVQAGYGSAGAAWEDATGLAYRVWAEHLVARLGDDLTGRLVLDAGAGTGAATRALTARRAVVVAADLVPGMLAHRAAARPPAVAADVAALPVRGRACAAAVAAFVLNHVADPAAVLAELARVVQAGGAVLASSFSSSRDPAKEAVDEVLASYGWQAPAWYQEVRRAGDRVGSVGALEDHARRAGLAAVRVDEVVVDLGLSPEEVVRYRLAMPQAAAFASRLDGPTRDALVTDAVHAVGRAGGSCRPVVLELAADVA